MLIKLPPEIEAGITAEAKARGVSVDTLLRDALSGFVRPQQKSLNDWDAELEKVIDTLPRLPVLPESALTREGIYEDDER